MERKIGEIFEFGGEWYQCVESDNCGECSLFTTECGSGTKSDLADKVVGQCCKVRRTDNKHVIFKKLEKVGEPFTSVGKLYQHYKVFDIDNVYGDVCGDVFWCIHNYKAKTLTIEIKQNKEDMEERELDPHMAKVIDEATQKLGEEIGRQIRENINKQRMKPFNLEAAKAGKPVCTRDGRKARIICFDKKGSTPIVGLIQEDGFETIATFTERGLCLINGAYNLMMLPEKKEGWMKSRENLF